MMGVGKFISSDFKDLRPKELAHFCPGNKGTGVTTTKWMACRWLTTMMASRHVFPFKELVDKEAKKGEFVDIKGKVTIFDKDNGRKVKRYNFDFDGKTCGRPIWCHHH